MSLATPGSPEAWAMNQLEFLPSEVIPDALILQCATIVTESLNGDAPVARIPWLNDAAAAFVSEGEEIDESTPDLAEITVATGKIAQLIPVSSEQYGQTGAGKLLSDSAARAVIKRANQAFLSQPAPTDGEITPPEGIFTQAGIVLTDPKITNNLDALAEAVGAVESNGGTPDRLLVNPSSWAALRNLKEAADSNKSLLGAGTNDVDKRLLGIQVTTSPDVPIGKLLVVDKTAIPAAVGPVKQAISDQLYFGSDRVAIRVMWRIGWKVAHPERLAVIDIDPANTGD